MWGVTWLHGNFIFLSWLLIGTCIYVYYKRFKLHAQRGAKIKLKEIMHVHTVIGTNVYKERAM